MRQERMERYVGLQSEQESVMPTHEGGAMLIPHNRIIPYPDQPRRHFSRESIQELADCIEADGQSTAVIVRGTEAVGQFMLVDGERRWRAAQLISRKTGKVFLLKATVEEISPANHFRSSFVANLHREDMHPLDQAAGLRRLQTEDGYTLLDLARVSGKSRTHVQNYLRLNDLDARVKAFMHPDLPPDEQLKVSAALEIARIQDKELQFEIASETLAASINLSEMRMLIERKAEIRGVPVHALRSGSERKRRPSDERALLQSFLSRGEEQVRRLLKQLDFGAMYSYHRDEEGGIAADKASAVRLIGQLEALVKVLDSI